VKKIAGENVIEADLVLDINVYSRTGNLCRALLAGYASGPDALQRGLGRRYQAR
jgi:hypothetical protein